MWRGAVFDVSLIKAGNGAPCRGAYRARFVQASSEGRVSSYGGAPLAMSPFIRGAGNAVGGFLPFSSLHAEPRKNDRAKSEVAAMGTVL